MRLPRARFTILGLIVAVGVAGLALGHHDWMARRAVERALARKQLAVIDEAWVFLEEMHYYARIEIDGGTIGPWGRRRLEALRKAGAGKAEIIAALEKYINDLDKLDEISKSRKVTARGPAIGDYEIRFLRIEAEMWLNEERAR